MHLRNTINKRREVQALKMKILVIPLFFLAMLSVVYAQGYDYCYSACREGPYEDCLAGGFGLEECKNSALEPCVAQCLSPGPYVAGPVMARPVPPPCPPTHDCEYKCASTYYSCTERARQLQDAEEAANKLQDCRLKVLDCLDNCKAESAETKARPPGLLKRAWYALFG
jgi:hypothetical protein